MECSKKQQMKDLVSLQQEIQQYMDLKAYIGSLRGISLDASSRLRKDVTMKVSKAEAEFISLANSYGD